MSTRPLATLRSDSSRGRRGVPQMIVETLGARAVFLGMGAVTSLIIARGLGPTGRGEYAFPVFLIGVLAIVGGLSYSNVHIHLVSQKAADSRSLAAVAFAVSGISGLASAALLILALLLVPAISSGLGIAPFLVAAIMLPPAIQQQALNSVAIASFAIRDVNRATVMSSIFHVVVIAALAAVGALTPISVIAAASATAICSWLWVTLAIRPPLRWPGRKLIKQALRFAARVHLGAVVMILVWRGDVVIVKAYLSLADVGIYTLAVMVAEMLLYLVEAIMAAATPRQIDMGHPNPVALTAEVHRLTLLALVLIAGLIAAPGALLLPIAYGSGFSGAVVPFLALLPGIILFGAFRTLNTYLLRLHNPWQLTTIPTAALALNVGLNLAIVRPLGIAGVAGVASVTYALIYVLTVVWFLRTTRADANSLIPRLRDLDRIVKLIVDLTPTRTAGGSS